MESNKKYMTIVFDDGPKKPMREMIDKFIKYGFKAGFAIMGERIDDSTESILKYAIDNGFQLSCHSQTHPRLEQLESKAEIRAELLEPIKEVEKRLNYKMTMARLPYITYNDTVLEVTKELGLTLLGHGIDGGSDWDPASTPQIISDAVLSTACDGAIACLHVTDNTNIALDTILPELKNRGYELVTPEELFKIKNKEIPLGININNVNLI